MCGRVRQNQLLCRRRQGDKRQSTLHYWAGRGSADLSELVDCRLQPAVCTRKASGVTRASSGQSTHYTALFALLVLPIGKTSSTTPHVGGTRISHAAKLSKYGHNRGVALYLCGGARPPKLTAELGSPNGTLPPPPPMFDHEPPNDLLDISFFCPRIVQFPLPRAHDTPTYFIGT